MAHTARWGTCERCGANCLPRDRFCTRCEIALDDAWAFGYSQTHGVSILEARAVLIREQPRRWAS